MVTPGEKEREQQAGSWKYYIQDEIVSDMLNLKGLQSNWDPTKPIQEEKGPACSPPAVLIGSVAPQTRRDPQRAPSVTALQIQTLARSAFHRAGRSPLRPSQGGWSLQMAIVDSATDRPITAKNVMYSHSH
ncbi:hypothetical protein CRENBAI_025887 [Crenichthys baileyi]|uniref:Uncharacterized protein n=1 Tax=Crenichthys baileyi TaxID=28760 RepID=A0AAV9RVZ7_9TELE